MPRQEFKTCPECTSPLELPQGMDRCAQCEAQDYQERHTNLIK